MEDDIVTPTGEYQDVNIPVSKMYVSKELKEEDKSNMKSLVFGTSQSRRHYYLIMKPDKLYTTDMVNNCQGRKSCFHCNRPIPNQIYFYPLEFMGGKSFRVSPLPHCRAECALATVTAIKSDLLSALFPQMWGLVSPADPRELLYLGDTIEQFHKRCDENQICEYSENRKIRALLAPVYVTSTLFKNHQLVPDVVKLMIDLESEQREALGPNGTEHTTNENMVPIEARNILESAPSSVFSLDPSTFRNFPS